MATIAGSVGGTGVALEQQIIQANPILEAFGNAQTVRNNNSSRFGKFVRIEFNNGGLICGGNIERYLLEKSRVTHRNPKERSFHVFYQFLQGAPAVLRQSMGISGGPSDYAYTRQSNCIVEGVDDITGYTELVLAMECLGFAEEERQSYFRIVAAILHLGNLRFEEDASGQARLLNTEVAERACQCLGIPTADFITGLLNPVFRAGRDELVAQARDVSQVIYSVEALSRSLYDRMFTKLVERINRTIDRSTPSSKGHFIGVLDIAGFEIFEKNSFEQLCINHTNEKLQQFFNHHMFVLEQEEYRKEAIAWDYIDFGLDLQPTIDLLEKSNPIGILACLDEDCVMPKATDRSFCEKIAGLWKGRSPKFEATRFGDGFIIHHYAGRVEYRTEGWLVKNKDPLNDNVTRLLARSSVAFVSSLFMDFAGSDEEVYQATKGTKKGLFRTVSQKHRESLALLMQTLYGTQPHFVRCIIPNEEKRPGILEARLVLDQLRCNGVLEGIRICRLGYPNRLHFADFIRLYELLASRPLPSDSREACRQLFDQLGMGGEGEAYRLGQSKIFLKAGIIGRLDEVRDHRLSALLRRFQATYRFILARRQRTRQARQQEAIQLLQRNVRLYLRLRQWSWWKLFSQIKPLLNVTRTEKRIADLEGELARISQERDQQLGQLRADLDSERNMLYAAETHRRDLERENQQLALQLSEANESKAALLERKMMLDLEVVRLRERISSELEGQREALQAKINTLEREQAEARALIDEQKMLMASLRMKADEAEFERAKGEKLEAASRMRIVELETALEEARRARRDLETKVRALEETRRQLQEQLEEEALEQERRRQLQTDYEQQLKQLRSQMAEELTERQTEWEANRKRLQREIHQVIGDLEAERKTTLSLRDQIKRYETGADSLATQLEAEMRNQSAWKREKERLEQRLRETTRAQSESVEREDALAAQVSSLYEQLREQRAKAMDLDEALATVERQRKTLETRYEALGEAHRDALTAKQTAEKAVSMLELQLTEATSKLHDEQDAAALLREQVRTTELALRVAQAEVETERRNGERLEQERAALEAQVKDLQLRLLESETTTPNAGASSSGDPRRRPSASYQQILATIEAEGAERLSLTKELRRQERLVRELTAQLGERDRQRISLEEALDKGELRVRKLQTTLEALETRTSELEVARRRAERDLSEERERAERLTRECERLKARSLLRTSAEAM